MIQMPTNTWEKLAHCTVSTGTGKKLILSLKPILASHIFQIVSVDIMDLPKIKVVADIWFPYFMMYSHLNLIH